MDEPSADTVRKPSTGYVLNPESMGAVRATMFRDRVEDRTRGRYYGENVYRSGPFTANASLEVPTDPRYYLDLVDNNALLAARHARSEGFVSATGAHSEHALSILWNKDLQEIPGPDNTVQRVPEYTMTLLPARIPVAGIDLSGEISATRFQRRDGYDELRARGFGEVSRAIPLYRSFTLVPYLFADVLGTRFEPSPANGPSDHGRFVPGGGATLSADARKDIPGRDLVHSAGVSAGFRYVPKIRPERASHHRPMVPSGAPEPVSLHAFTTPSRGEGGRRAEGVPVVPHRVGL